MGFEMYVSEPMTDDQPLMRFFAHDKFERLLNPRPGYESWEFVIGAPPANPPVGYGSLWMALPHVFIDKNEGTFPALNMDDEQYCAEMAKHLGKTEAEAAECRARYLNAESAGLRAGIRARAKLCGVSCWYQDSSESQRMWDEYSDSRKGVLIKTTLARFEAAISQLDPYQGNEASVPNFRTIQYVSLDDFFLPQDGYWDLLTIKGEGFIHEREVRLLGKSPQLVSLPRDGRSPSLDEIQKVADSPPAGFNLLIDLVELTMDVRVHPEASDEYLREIKELATAHGIQADLVQRSELAK